MQLRKIITPGRCIVYGILGILFAGWVVIAYLGDKDYSIATLRSKIGYVFDIRTPYFSDITQVIYCQIRKDDEIISHKMIGLAAVEINKLKFSLIEDDSGIVAITEQTNPHVVIGIFDVNYHIGVPFLDSGKEEEERIGEELIQRLNKATQGEPFVLGGGALGWPIQENDKHTNTFGEIDE